MKILYYKNLALYGNVLTYNPIKQINDATIAITNICAKSIIVSCINSQQAVIHQLSICQANNGSIIVATYCYTVLNVFYIKWLFTNLSLFNFQTKHCDAYSMRTCGCQTVMEETSQTGPFFYKMFLYWLINLAIIITFLY